ncbi:hypothetical protein BCR42DRAFT_431601 [Absidia repens]|uniref:FAD/NAD(P)-binding domain-containing protein n=1 Tax=Absidia repens TaxID=90262 RepID=A0A1X2J422_9FUNG|nr:hypothetical protein BCR42DRAFT_431601 [Absidia repens]
MEALHDPYLFDTPISNVAVIGAGPSGLAAAKSLLEQGFDIQLFERNTKVGGNWVFSQPAQSKLYIPSMTDQHDAWLEKNKTEVGSGSGNQLPSFLHSLSPVKCTKEVEYWLNNHHHPSTACYQNLTTNTATPILGSFDFPWPKDSPYFVSHTDVQNYLQNYATHFGLDKFTHLNTSLDNVEKKGTKWELTLTEAKKDASGEYVSIKQYKSTFDAVVIATGQFQDPSIPPLEGLKEFNTLFPGKITHSKQFRQADDFKNKNVLVIGGRVSAVDVARIVSTKAKQVYISYRGPFETKIGILDLIRSVIPDNVIHKPGVEGFWCKDPKSGNTLVDGTITFKDGTTVNDIDAIVFATGYQMKHSYFGSARTLTTDTENGSSLFTCKNDTDEPLVVMDKSKVHNTYKDIFLISDPTLAFAGAPRHVTITPFFEYQAQTIARVWLQQAQLPSQEKMKTFSLQRTQVCPVYQMDHESERLRCQILLPWLNLHAHKLVPDLNLPTLDGPADSLEPIWSDSAAAWLLFIKKQQEAMKSEGQE